MENVVEKIGPGKMIDISLFFRLFFENTLTEITIVDNNFNVITHNKKKEITNQLIYKICWWNQNKQENDKLLKHLNICKDLKKETSFESIHFNERNEKVYYKTIISPVILEDKLFAIKIEELDITEIKKTLIERDDLLQQLTVAKNMDK
jgi:hypothetical protein